MWKPPRLLPPACSVPLCLCEQANVFPKQPPTHSADRQCVWSLKSARSAARSRTVQAGRASPVVRTRKPPPPSASCLLCVSVPLHLCGAKRFPEQPPTHSADRRCFRSLRRRSAECRRTRRRADNRLRTPPRVLPWPTSPFQSMMRSRTRRPWRIRRSRGRNAGRCRRSCSGWGSSRSASARSARCRWRRTSTPCSTRRPAARRGGGRRGRRGGRAA